MTLERTIEAKAVLALERIGCAALKFGQDGWPDRLVVLGRGYPGHVIWIEFKTAEGRLRPAQKVRHKQLAALGHTVVVCRSPQEALGAVARQRRFIDRATNRD